MAITAAMRTEVTKLYVALFGRAPDSDGLGYWVSQVDGGKTIAQVAQDMYNTTPARTTYPLYLTNTEIVTAFYTNVLGRTPDTDGAAYWATQLGTKTAGQVISDMITAVTAYTGTDSAATTSKTLFANKAAVAEYYAVTLAGGATNAAAAISGVTATTDVSTNAAMAAAISGAGVSTSTGTTYTLTTGIDTVLGTTNNDTIVAYVGVAGDTAATLSVADQIDGGAGTDTLSVILTNTALAAASTPVTSGIEVVTLRALSNETAYFSLANMGTGVTALNVSGSSDINVAGLSNGSKVAFSGNYAKTATLAIGTNSTADTITLTMNDVNSADVVANDYETVNLVANTTAAFINGEAFGIGTAQTLNVSGSANVVLNFGVGSGNGRGAYTGTGIAGVTQVSALKTISATALTGTLTLVASTAGVDQTILGGAGNDTFYVSAQFNQSDSLDGGAGTDTVVWTNATTGTFRPVIQGVETFTMDFGAEAVIDLRNTSAASISTLNVLGVATASTFSALSSATKTINAYSGASAGGITFNYATGAASDVVFNLSNEAAATSTASYVFGDLTLANNTGSLTLNVVGSATGQGVENFAANNADALVINVTSGQFIASGTFNANAASAVTLNVNNGKSATIIGDASFTGATSVAINLSGATANANLDDINFGANGAMTVTLGAGASGFTMGTAAFGATALTASVTNSITVVNNGSATVTLSGLDLTTAAVSAASASQVTFSLNVNQTGSGAVFNSTAMQFGSIDTAALTVTLAGQGVFNLAATGSLSALTGQVVMNSTAMSTGFVSALFTAMADTNVIFDVRLGAHSAVISLGAGADKVQFGLNNQQSVIGGLGNDELTMNNTAVSIAVYEAAGTAATALDGTDTIFGAGTGDIILFQGYNTSTGTGAIIATAVTTGTGWSHSTAAFTAGGTGVVQVFGTSLIGNELSNTANEYFMAMYTAAGDMIIQVLVMTASPTASVAASADSITQIVLNGKGDVAKTALLRIDTNGSGLLLTLL